jgi:hypothetical protein
MALPLDDSTELMGLLTLEAQFAYIASKLQTAQNAYNTTHPNTPTSVISLNADYGTSNLAISSTLELDGDAATGTLTDNVVEAISQT